mmetsp:Transcript_32574/g.70969  ORF Transcript_32574/g.70969 Transcript_32574/m.70969 type:complete len:232 (-) Transcript_32574:627-1322(-)
MGACLTLNHALCELGAYEFGPLAVVQDVECHGDPFTSNVGHDGVLVAEQLQICLHAPFEVESVSVQVLVLDFVQNEFELHYPQLVPTPGAVDLVWEFGSEFLARDESGSLTLFGVGDDVWSVVQIPPLVSPSAPGAQTCLHFIRNEGNLILSTQIPDFVLEVIAGLFVSAFCHDRFQYKCRNQLVLGKQILSYLQAPLFFRLVFCDIVFERLLDVRKFQFWPFVGRSGDFV